MSRLSIDSQLKRKYVPQLEEIDFATYGIMPSENYRKIASRFPDAYKLLRFGDKVLGYTLLLGLNKNCLDALKQGKIGEEEISVRDISQTYPEGVYIASIASAPSMRNQKPFVSGTLVGSLTGRILDFRGEVIAMPVTRTGINLARMLSLEPTEIVSPTNQSYELVPTIWRKK
jgi:hypothetical protein